MKEEYTKIKNKRQYIDLSLQGCLLKLKEQQVKTARQQRQRLTQNKRRWKGKVGGGIQNWRTYLVFPKIFHGAGERGITTHSHRYVANGARKARQDGRVT